MCNCGCNTCETKGPLLTEGKVKSLLSEGLQYHIDKKIPLFETVYRIGSKKHLSLIKEARKMYSRNVIDLCEEDEALIKTHLGEFALYEGESVPLDLPMLNEEVDSYYLDNAKERLSNAYKILGKETGQTRRGDKYLQINYIPKSSPQTQSPEFVKIFYDNDNDLKGLDLPMLNESYDYDEVAQSEFGMDYDQLGDNEKEWVRDEIDNMEMNEVTRYSGFDRNPEDPDSEPFQPTGSVSEFREDLRALFGKFKGDLKNPEFIKGVAQIMVNWKSLLRSQLNESDSKYPNFDLNKNIRYQDTSISSGMWRYTGKEQGGKGVYRNLNNGQILGFDRSDFDIFRKNLSSHFDISESINENEDKLLKIKQELEALRPGTISWIDDIFISSYDGSLQVELDYTLYPNEIKQLAQIAAKYGMELKYMTGKNATLVKTLQEKLKGIDGKECWKGYKLSGTKKKGGKTVDNCVPMEEAKKEIDEAEFKGKEVALNKPKRGGPKAYYVYVKDGDKVKKVTFGSGGLRAKIKNKEARNAFAARHNCKDKKDRTKAGYWSCNLPRYAPALGLGAKMNTFW